MRKKLRRFNTNNSRLEHQIGYMQQVVENSDEEFDKNTAEGILKDVEDTLNEYKSIMTDMEEELR